jgi:hypothetical protein
MNDYLSYYRKEDETRLNEYQNQIDNLMEELQKKTLPSVQTADHESQTDDHQHEKLVQMNNKLKRVLQLFKEKIQRIVAERSDLFDGVGEETSERLEHLISTVDSQAVQIGELQNNLSQKDEQQTLLEQRLNEVERELIQTTDR